nr:retrovirus-related Pol polyprotein from transposon TNT 1-94 [Tanacetum cinerariifolium]
CDIMKPIWYLDSGCLRHMTGVKSYLHKYEEQPGPKVMFGDDSVCTTEGYGSIKCNGIVFTNVAFRGTIFNSNKEFIMIAPQVRDVYVLDMTSSAQEYCFFAKACDNLNWLWHKRLAHLNFKTINKLAKQNLVIGLPSLVYTKDKPCSSCEKIKHHRDSFKTKQTSFIKKCLYLLHMDLFVPITPRSIIHEKYTLVIVDEYSGTPGWIPIGKIFESSTTKVDSEPLHGSNTDITNLQECIQTLDSSASTSINVQEEQDLDLRECTPFNLKKERIKSWIKENVISGRPRLHGITFIQDKSARQSSKGIRSLLTF